jgi:uncharacterized protein (TIGR03083 family)
VLLSPRYDATPLIAIEARSAGAHPVVQQRRRLEATLGELTDAEWRTPSRCEAWTAQDVITHLDSTDRFWALSVGQAVAGEPTRFLGTFDPVASPAQLVDSTRGTSPEATLDAFRQSNAAMLEAIEALDDAGWDAIGEAPPGHVPLRLVADHALWDSWVHERDVLLPMGRPAPEEVDEVATCLRYAAALGPAFEIQHGGRHRTEAHGAVETSDPDLQITVTIAGDQVHVADGPAPAGAVVVRLPAVPLLEMLSRRDAGRPEPSELEWFTGGLSRVFDERGAAPAG